MIKSVFLGPCSINMVKPNRHRYVQWASYWQSFVGTTGGFVTWRTGHSSGYAYARQHSTRSVRNQNHDTTRRLPIHVMQTCLCIKQLANVFVTNHSWLHVTQSWIPMGNMPSWLQTCYFEKFQAFNQYSWYMNFKQALQGSIIFDRWKNL